MRHEDNEVFYCRRGKSSNKCDPTKAQPIIETDHIKEEAKERLKKSKHEEEKYKKIKTLIETYSGCGCVVFGCFLPSLLLFLTAHICFFILIWKIIQK